MLEITAGIYKKRRIKVIGEISRPTTARTRMMIFDILRYLVPSDFTFLDAFAGSGIMGMEALSRGASKVVFFEINGRCIKLIEDSLNTMDKLQGIYMVRKCNTMAPPKGTPMNVIFLDPPYDQPYLLDGALKKLQKYNWIDDDSIIVIETDKYSSEKKFNSFELIKARKMSNSYINFFKKIPFPQESSSD